MLWSDLWAACSVVNLDALGTISAQCLGSYDFYWSFVYTGTYPLILGAIILAVTYFRRSIAKAEGEARLAQITSQGWKLILFLLFLVYPSVSAGILKVFHCREVGALPPIILRAATDHAV